MERDQLLKSQLKTDNDYIEQEEIRRRDFAAKLAHMHEDNLSKERMQREENRMMDKKMDRDALESGIKIQDSAIKKRREDIMRQK